MRANLSRWYITISLFWRLIFLKFLQVIIKIVPHKNVKNAFIHAQNVSNMNNVWNAIIPIIMIRKSLVVLVFVVNLLKM